MTRYFYTDPLAAAWMSKHFGMRFADGCEPFSVSVMSSGINTPRAYEVDDTDEKRIHIHPDSVHLLEPQEGDLFRRKGTPVCHHCGMAHYGEYEPDTGPEIARIIQRNGIPFMWPEVEP